MFTTRPDTIFGASFIALSVDHPSSKDFSQDKKFKEFQKRQQIWYNEEALANAEKLGFKSNLFVNHPFIKNKKYQFIC